MSTLPVALMHVRPDIIASERNHLPSTQKRIAAKMGDLGSEWIEVKQLYPKSMKISIDLIGELLRISAPCHHNTFVSLVE